MEQSENEQPPVKELPPRVSPSPGDKADRGVGHVVLDVHDVHVDEGEEKEDDP